MEVKAITSQLGNSDFVVDGRVTNYIKYIFEENETIVGNMALKSTKIDLNQFMTSEEENDSETSAETTAYSVIEVPRNIDFILND